MVYKGGYVVWLRWGRKKKEEEEEGPVGSRTCGTEHRGPGVDWTSGRGLVRAQPGLF